MEIRSANVAKLMSRYKEISALTMIKDALEWDSDVCLPDRGVSARAEQNRVLSDLITRRTAHPRYRGLLAAAQSELATLSPTEQAIVRNLEYKGKFHAKVPRKLIVEQSGLITEATSAWEEARKQDNFGTFLPYLDKLVLNAQRAAEHLGYQANPYDAHLDMFEPGLTAETCRYIFGNIQPHLVAILKRIKGSPEYSLDTPLVRQGLVYPASSQKLVVEEILTVMGYDYSRGRTDVSAHPATYPLGSSDIRTTVAYDENDFRSAVTSATHEGGHALHYQGVNPEYDGTPLEGSPSTGISEATSRLWENMIGRDPELLRFFYPIFQKAFPDQLKGVDAAEVVRAFNLVKPSLIRIDADEVTYNLHVILRFEFENALLNGSLKAADVPAAWNSMIQRYLDIEPSSDKDGALQDIHWSNGLFGYFPAYALGNVYAAQFMRSMEQEVNVKDALRKGELGAVKSWMDLNIHQHGSLYRPEELVRRVTGEGLNPQYFVDYLDSKYRGLYPD